MALLCLAGSLLASSLQAQHLTLRVPGVRPETLQARGFDVVGTQNRDALVVVDVAERQRLASFGWNGTPVVAPGTPSARIAQQPALTVTRVYRSYDDPQRGVRTWVDSMARAFPAKITVDTIGRSYEGRPMLAVKIGSAGDSPSRPNVVFMACYHAREWAAAETAMRLIRYLATTTGSARVDSLLQTRDIWIVPVANPDGYQYTFTTDRLWRKTRSPQAAGFTGVDMNRNHRTNWGVDNSGSSPDAFSEIFRGPSAASEIETRNIEAFHAAHPPVMAVSYHTFAGLLLFPPGSQYGLLGSDLPVYRTLGGTNLRPAIPDRVPASSRTRIAPGPAWLLYTTNGEYTDWASATYGTIAFTPELSSGYGSNGYYGFEFPDDEASLKQLFDDNLPFALDVIEAARAPFDYASPTTMTRTDRVQLESIAPTVRVTVPAAAATTATITAPASVGFRVDSANAGRYTRRLISTAVARPSKVTVTTGTGATSFTVLAANGAESGETGWTSVGLTRDSVLTVPVAGKASWASTGGGELRTPVITVPADADTVTLAFWTRYNGDGFSDAPATSVLMSLDGGATFTPVMRLQGFAPLWYPEHVTVGGVRGRKIAFAFDPLGMESWFDELAVVAHGTVATAAAGATRAFVPSENPVRSSAVRFSWPFGATNTGEITAYDISGRLIWKQTVRDGAPVTWDLAGARLANGVYLILARSGGRTERLKLFVVRDGR
jgi:murein tripeptide amidase MpaA